MIVALTTDGWKVIRVWASEVEQDVRLRRAGSKLVFDASGGTADGVPLTSVELFAGGGGMAVGTGEPEFEHLALVEWYKPAATILRHNARTAPEPLA